MMPYRIRKMRRVFFSALLVFCFAFSACPLASANSALLGSDPPDSKTVHSSILYYRYLDSMWLGQEQRNVNVPHTESLEKEIGRASCRERV